MIKKPIPNTQRPYDNAELGRGSETRFGKGNIQHDDDDDQDMRMLIGNDNFGDDFE